uniref:Uncharacterized protein n=1 Tax=Solanum lycopersicum TaxID=4081 RepID=A0A3Q7JBQ3_SOLLC
MVEKWVLELLILWMVSSDLELNNSLEMEKMKEQCGLVVNCCSLVNLEVTGASFFIGG